MNSQNGKSDFMQYISGLAAGKNNTGVGKFVEEVVSDVCGQLCEEIKEKIAKQAQRGAFTTSQEGKTFAGNYIIPNRVEGVGEYTPEYSIEEVNAYLEKNYPGISYLADEYGVKLIFADAIEEKRKKYAIKDGGMKIINKVKDLAREHGISIEEGINHTLTVDISNDERKKSQSMLLKYAFVIPE